MTKDQWQAIRDQDSRYDGILFCGIISSRIVCRPSCTARVRRARNIVIFDSLSDALAQGYHPCPRCRPDRENWQGARKELVLSAQAWIESHSAEKFSLKTLSGALYVNGSYLLRTYKEITGTTLLWYHNHIRCEKAKALLAEGGKSISEAGEQAGFCSSSHFSRIFKKMVGCTPSEYRKAYYRELEK